MVNPSERENSLESELDTLEMERHRIVDASYKWQQAQVMTSYAYEQLKFACKKWLSIKEIDQRLAHFDINQSELLLSGGTEC